MRYRFKPSEKEHIKPRRGSHPVRAGGKCVRKPKNILYSDTIILTTLFETAELGAPQKEKKRRVHSTDFFCSLRSNISRTFKKATASLKAFAKKANDNFTRFRNKKKSKKRLSSLLPALTGVLTAAVVVALFSLFAVIWKLVITDYFGSYTTITVPQLVGRNYEDTLQHLDDDTYNLTVRYEFDDDIPSGTVISQTPAAGVSRRVVEGELFCNINLIVSKGIKTFTMNDYRGKPLRSCLLELKNGAVRFALLEEYSDDVESGRIISTTPAAGEKFFESDTVTLHVSIGKKVVFSTVPNICGLTEIQASSLLLASGLTVGEILYSASDEPAGTVIVQSVSPFSSIEYGSEISFTVSAGYQFNDKKIPDLYGLTISEAKERLADFGLVAGNIYETPSSEPSGRVIAQSPQAGSPLMPSRVTVDFYVSS